MTKSLKDVADKVIERTNKMGKSKTRVDKSVSRNFCPDGSVNEHRDVDRDIDRTWDIIWDVFGKFMGGNKSKSVKFTINLELQIVKV